jgi:hypothetical protein
MKDVSQTENKVIFSARDMVQQGIAQLNIVLRPYADDKIYTYRVKMGIYYYISNYISDLDNHKRNMKE